jgi:hypothetical protein
MPPLGRTLSVRFIIIGTIVVIVPFFMLLLFKTLTLLATVFDPIVCISAIDDVRKSQSSYVPPVE